MPHDVPALWKMVLELWNSGKPELATEVYAANAEYRQPGREPIHGPREIARWIGELHAAFPDFRMTITRTVTEGNQFVLGWTCSGTHNGPFMGVPGSGKRVEVHGVTMGRLSHGRIHDEHVYYDRLEFLEEVGAVTAPHRELAGV